jgi:hypothetical protein
MTGSTRRASGILMLAVWLSGCSTWRTESVAPQQFITENRPGKIRLLLNDSNTVQVQDPRILRDSVVGDQYVGNTNRRVAVPMGDILSVQTSHLNIGKTALYGAGIIGGVALLVILSGQSNTGCVYC